MESSKGWRRSRRCRPNEVTMRVNTINEGYRLRISFIDDPNDHVNAIDSVVVAVRNKNAVKPNYYEISPGILEDKEDDDKIKDTLSHQVKIDFSDETNTDLLISKIESNDVFTKIDRPHNISSKNDSECQVKEQMETVLSITKVGYGNYKSKSKANTGISMVMSGFSTPKCTKSITNYFKLR